MRLEVFSTDFPEIINYRISLKIRPVGAELIHADGRTDVAKLTVAFRNFTNAPKHTAKRTQSRTVRHSLTACQHSKMHQPGKPDTPTHN